MLAPYGQALVFRRAIFGLPAARAHRRPASRQSRLERCRALDDLVPLERWGSARGSPVERRLDEFHAGNAGIRQLLLLSYPDKAFFRFRSSAAGLVAVWPLESLIPLEEVPPSPPRF